MLVAISGAPGSGKTTLGKLLAEALGVEFVSTGQIFRQMAEMRGEGLEAFSKLAEADPAIDKELDSRQVEIGKHGNLVLEGRLSCLLPKIKADFRIWVDADKKERAKRISKRDGTTISEAQKELKYREASEKKRYSSYYKIDLDDRAPYDLEVDTTNATPKQSLETVLEFIRGQPSKSSKGKSSRGRESITKKEGSEMDMKKIGIGSICVKTMGRDKGECVILDFKENRALVTGPKPLTGVRRRYVNLTHITPTGRSINVGANASEEKVAEALGITLSPARQRQPKEKAAPTKEIKRLKVPKGAKKAEKAKASTAKKAAKPAAKKKAAPKKSLKAEKPKAKKVKAEKSK